MLSVDSQTDKRGKVYQHDEGEYGVFYDAAPDVSTIKVVTNGQSHVTKIWTNLEFNSECYDGTSNDIYDETFNSIRITNEHQDTGLVVLTSPSTIRRRFRTWRHAIQRDNNSTNQARIRNPWIFTELTFNNNDNKRFIAHDILSYFLT